MRIVSALCIILILTTAAVAQNLTTPQILAKLDEKAKVFKSLEASIVQQQVLSEVKKAPETGKIYMKLAKPAPMVLVDITSPKNAAKTALIRDEKALIYFREQKAYQESRIGPRGSVFDLVLTGFGVPSETLKKYYTPEAKGREMIDGVAAEVLELTTLPGQTGDVKKVTLWLDPKLWIPVQTRVTFKSNDTTDFKYSNVRLNGNLNDSVFKVNIPSGASKL
jgi:outer membrane lipoprotein-sorting protein